MAKGEGYWTELWEEWFRPLSQDCLKTFSILAVLYAFWEAINFMRFRGYQETFLEKLESAHFAFMYSALVVLGAAFVFRLVIGLWPKRK